MLTLLAMAGTSVAQTNALTVADVTVPQNAEAELTVSFQLDAADTYTGYSFQIEIPSELEFVMAEGTDIACTKGSCHDATHSVTANLSEGLAKVAGLSLASKPLVGTSGTLLTFTIRPATGQELTVGQTFTGTIKNILIVPVEGDKKTLADATFTITIGEPDDGRIKFNENSASLPKYTAGEKGNVTMTRSIQAGHWSTIVLPFTLTKAKAEAAFGADVQVAEFTGFETTYSDEDDVTPDAITIKLTPLTMTGKKGMTGGKPYMIKTSQDITTFQADDVTLIDAVTDVQGADDYDTAGKLTGSLVATTIPADGLYVSDNKFWYSAGQTSVKAFRCWFELGAVLDQETDFGARVYLAFEDETTGIKAIDNFTISQSDNCYDLSGRKIVKSSNGKMPKGLYIVNNKKVVVK
jgi:hypothetical protein